MTYLLVTAIFVALVFAFINGFHDGCNVFATAVASCSISPRKALLIGCISEFAVPVFAGTAVASTVGKGVLTQEALESIDVKYSILIIITALMGAIIWNLITWKFGLPSSSSHALIGGLVGAGVTALGVETIKWSILLNKIILVLLLTPFIGFAVGFLFIKVSTLLLKNRSIGINNVIKRLHVLSIFFLAGSHGTADAQKSMGIIALLLVISKSSNVFHVPIWVKICAAGCLSLGVLFGGWKIIHTVGNKIYRLKPRHSLNAQLASAGVIYVSSVLGGTVSTSQIVSSTIMGVGTGERYKAVKWKVVESIILSWLLTIPVVAVLSGLLFLTVKLFI